MNNKIRKEIQQMFNLNIIDEQYYSWGETYWLQLDPTNAKADRTVSVVTVYPDKEHKVHTHPGYEEIIIGLEGEMIHWANGHQIVLKPGQFGYIPENGQHSFVNESGQNAKMISIVNATFPNDLKELTSVDDIELKDITNLVNLGFIAEKFAHSVNLAVTLIDPLGNFLTEPKKFPSFCSLCMQQKQGDCILNLKSYDEQRQLTISKCKFNIYSVQSPIVVNERILGYIGCGYGRVGFPSENEKQLVKLSFEGRDKALAQKYYVDLDVINRNHLKSVAETLSLFSGSLVHTLIDSARGKQISSYKLSLAKEKHRQAELNNSLNEARLKFLESQVNPHFLFNTLNTIAQISFMEGATTASSLTYALSNLLRRGLGKSESLITVAEELAHINDYLLIQKTRFPNRFEVNIEVNEDTLSTKIPFMTLMVLVENSIIHGFANIKWKGMINITGKTDEDGIIIEVEDNGEGIPLEVISHIKLLGNTSYETVSLKGIGLKNIYKRLEYYYGNNFVLNIERLPDRGTRTIIKLPL
ncbi:MAG: histidine kinase [Bacillota bacterium]|nr:histidine kinase [Bacillota bacterium]